MSTTLAWVIPLSLSAGAGCAVAYTYMKEKLSDAGSNLDLAHKKISESSSKVDALSGDLRAKEEELANAYAAIELSNEKLRSQAEKIEDLTREAVGLHEFQGRIQNILEEHARKASDLQLQIQDLVLERTELMQKNRDLVLQSESLTSALNAKKGEVAQLNEQIKRLDVKLSDFTSASLVIRTGKATRLSGYVVNDSKGLNDATS